MDIEPQHPTWNERQAAIRKHKKKMATKKAERRARKEWDSWVDEDRKNSMTYEDKLATVFKKYNELFDKEFALIKRMGLSGTRIVDKPTDMTETKVVERINNVIETNHRTPSIIDLLNDFDLANAVRMLTRHDYNHEAVVCAARNRIFLRSRQLEDAEKLLKNAVELIDALLKPMTFTSVIEDKIDKLCKDITNLRSMDPKLDETANENET